VGAAYFIRDPNYLLDGPDSPLPTGEFEVPLTIADRGFLTDGELQWFFLLLYNSYFDPIQQKAVPIEHLIRNGCAVAVAVRHVPPGERVLPDELSEQSSCARVPAMLCDSGEMFPELGKVTVLVCPFRFLL
jgi:hypothetical protein